MKDFPSWLNELMAVVGVTDQKAFGKLIKASQGSVSKWRTGKSLPELDNRRSLDELAVKHGFPPYKEALTIGRDWIEMAKRTSQYSEDESRILIGRLWETFLDYDRNREAQATRQARQQNASSPRRPTHKK